MLRMELKRIVGNIRVYATKNNDNNYLIQLYNGSDCIYKETYFTDLEYAILDSLENGCDIYTEKMIGNMHIVSKRLSNNTFICISGDGTGKQDYLCRIKDTEYFKHYFKAPDEFIKDKKGMRIIDR